MKKSKLALAAFVVAGASFLLPSCDTNTTNSNTTDNTGNTTGAAPDERRVTGVDGTGDLPGTGREDTTGIIQTEADTSGATNR